MEKIKLNQYPYLLDFVDRKTGRSLDTRIIFECGNCPALYDGSLWGNLYDLIGRYVHNIAFFASDATPENTSFWDEDEDEMDKAVDVIYTQLINGGLGFMPEEEGDIYLYLPHNRIRY